MTRHRNQAMLDAAGPNIHDGISRTWPALLTWSEARAQRQGEAANLIQLDRGNHAMTDVNADPPDCVAMTHRRRHRQAAAEGVPISKVDGFSPVQTWKS